MCVEAERAAAGVMRITEALTGGRVRNRLRMDVVVKTDICEPVRIARDTSAVAWSHEG